jgi:hypothetical protein
VGDTLTVDVDTPIGPLQNVALLIGSSSVPLPARLTSASLQSFGFIIPADITPGTGLLVRLRVDGVESPLRYDASLKTYTQPTVTIT